MESTPIWNALALFLISGVWVLIAWSMRDVWSVVREFRYQRTFERELEQQRHLHSHHKR